MAEIAQVQSRGEIDAARDLIREYTDWTFSLTPESSDAPTFQGIDEEIAALPGIYVPPSGRLLLATRDGEPVGCVCLKPRDSTTGELKRLYVRPEYRGLGLGGQLVDALKNEARAAGYRRIVLDTHISMKSAHAIYLAAGFRLAGTPRDFPEHLQPVAVFMELDVS